MTLQEFLNKNKRATDATKQIAISKRIANEKGEPFLFTIKGLTIDEFDELRSTNISENKDGTLNYKNSKLFIDLIIKSTVNPDFKNKEDMEKIGVKTPEDYVKNVLLAGEIQTYAAQIYKFNGFNTNVDELTAKIEN